MLLARAVAALACACMSGAAFGLQVEIYSGVDAQGVVTLSTMRTAQTPQLLSGATERMGLRAPAAKRARFASDVARASAATGVPEALIHAVIQVESNYDPAAVSPKGARGLMQLMPATARRFGSSEAAGAADNILAGSRYLKYLLDQFDQDVELALAAYNAGEAAVARAGRRVPAYAETLQYVPRVMEQYRRLAPP
ncbi:lytic transglycosylase domain-containing protein [Ramlibacter sp. MMS24-I3-19]|uniref:lytic transglycosylase domain-containing protein n=1 Tax=Ramlibacter sp. MMS24-I3-19 TaxID=3416606 RepID=UPI003CFD63B3